MGVRRKAKFRCGQVVIVKSEEPSMTMMGIMSEAAQEDYLFDMEPCICDHFRKQHHFRTDHCTYPCCGCTKFDPLYKENQPPQ